MNTLNKLYELTEREGVQVFSFPLNARDALSVMDDDGKCYVAIDKQKIKSDAEEISKLAHELGHCATGAFYNVYSPLNVRRRYENIADKWAIKHLISQEELERAVSAGYTEIWQLAEYFNVTEPLMAKAVSWYNYGNLYSA